MNEQFMRYLPRVAKFQRRMENQDLLLRLLRLTDLPLLHALFESAEFSSKQAAGSWPFISLFSFWRWLSSVFELIYVITVRRYGDNGIIGFIGLYDVTIHKSLTLSIAIFDQRQRGKGYGKGSVEMLLEQLRKKMAVEKVRVEVLKTDLRSSSFFQVLGFTACGCNENKILLERHLKERTG